MARPTSWRARMQSAGPPRITRLDKPFAGVPAGTPLLIPDPPLLRDFVAAIPRGQTRTAAEMRAALAAAGEAGATCPVTAGICLRIVAEAALEDLAEGRKPAEITPFWRVVAPEDPAAAKLSCGPDFIAAMRAMERQAPDAST